MIKAGEGNSNIETFYMPPSYKILLQLSAANAYGPNHEQLFLNLYFSQIVRKYGTASPAPTHHKEKN